MFEIIPRILADRDVDFTVSKANPQPTEEPKQTSPITAPDNDFSDERFKPVPVSLCFYFWVTVISLIDLLGLLSIIGSLSTMRTGRDHTGRAGAEFIALAIFLLPLIVYFYYSSGMKAETLREHRYFIVLGKYFPILVVLMRLLTVNL